MKFRWLNVSVVALGILMMWPTSQAHAFCGFFAPSANQGGTSVKGVSDKLYSDATQVVMVREGTKTVLSMRNTYQGPLKDFALVIPVPVVLKKGHVKVLDDVLFQKIDTLAAPKLVEYWEQNPCPNRAKHGDLPLQIPDSSSLMRSGGGAIAGPHASVKIEAKFKEGEYEIVVLSAKEANALEQWLLANKYNIPTGAASMLAGYVQKGMYFFVAKVDVKKVKFNKQNEAMLSPLRFHYDSDDFSLPVRLGLLNARGMQDLIIHILAQAQRYEVANAKNVTIPTNLIVDKSVKTAFAPFYAALFDYTMEQNPGAVVTEYAWPAAKCDPCPKGNLGGALEFNDLQMFGMELFDLAQKRRIINLSGDWRVDSGVEPPNVGKLKQELRFHVQRCGHEHFVSNNLQEARLRFKIKVADKKRKIKVEATPSSGPKGVTQRLGDCVKDHFERFDVSVVKAMVGGSNFTMDGSISLSSQVQVDNQWQMTQNWVLTRLHARYNAKTLKDDLVFAKADPISGGRGTPVREPGVLVEQGAKKSSINNFQARYAILYPWTGKMTCEAPLRGHWGPPPNNGQWTFKPALELASTPRNKVKLSSAIKSKNAPGLPWYKAK